MTVCIAAMFNWNYGDLKTPNFGKAILTVADRQLTAGDVEYEPRQLKMSFLTSRALLLFAGDVTVHSEAVLRTMRQVQAVPESDPGIIAELYAGFLREIKFRYGVQKYLSPLGLDQESFYSSHRDFAPEFLGRLTDQLQSYDGPSTEAIIAGTDGNSLQIWVVDEESKVSNHSDIGFAAIGIGAWHAKSTLMAARFTNNLPFAAVLAFAYAAKKRAQIAPGVGNETDIHLITKQGWEPLLPETKTFLQNTYTEFEERRDKLALEMIEKIDDFIAKKSTSSPKEQQSPTSPIDDPSHQPPSQE
jgi:hypothetical protein